MKTFSAKPLEVTRKWYVIDATGAKLGRLAVEAANILRGKNKPQYTPNVDTGDFVIVINADKAILTGNKLEKKYYRHHTGWVGHLKEVKYSILMNKNPEFAYELAVKGMLPNNVLGRNALRRLRIYKGEAHPHAAQQPEVWNID